MVFCLFLASFAPERRSNRLAGIWEMEGCDRRIDDVRVRLVSKGQEKEYCFVVFRAFFESETRGGFEYFT